MIKKKIKLRGTFFIIVISVLVLGTKYKDEHTFSTNRWIKYPRERVNMVDDLFEKHNLVGFSKEKIIELLGYETEAAYFKEVDNFVYYMGDERALISIDSEWLVIAFDDNIVIDVGITRD